MAIVESLPVMATLGAAGAVALKSPELLKEIYGDLAKPGVAQVGKALESVLCLGNNVLLPIRLMNEMCRRFEEKKFADIAKRFSSIPIENIVDVRPEIGTPILEKLSYTEDQVLRDMFIELLAKAADKSQVDKAHPAFVGIIENITPDEALFIKSFTKRKSIPYFWIWKKINNDGVFSKTHDFIIHEIQGICFPKNIPVYVSNLSGLGIITSKDDAYIPDTALYDPIFQEIKKNIPDIQIGDVITVDNTHPDGSVFASKGVIELLPFGRSFQDACISEK